MGDYRYRVVLYGVAVSTKTGDTSNDYVEIDETFEIDSDEPLEEEDIINDVLSRFESNNQKFIRKKSQLQSGIDRISKEDIFGIEEEQDDRQWLINRDLLDGKNKILVRDERGRFISPAATYREMKLNSFKDISESIPEYTTTHHTTSHHKRKR